MEFSRWTGTAEQRALLLARPELAAGAVEEVLRHSSSLNAIYRVALEDVEIGGQHIRKGVDQPARSAKKFPLNSQQRSALTLAHDLSEGWTHD